MMAKKRNVKQSKSLLESNKNTGSSDGFIAEYELVRKPKRKGAKK